MGRPVTWGCFEPFHFQISERNLHTCTFLWYNPLSLNWFFQRPIWARSVDYFFKKILPLGVASTFTAQLFYLCCLYVNISVLCGLLFHSEIGVLTITSENIQVTCVTGTIDTFVISSEHSNCVIIGALTAPLVGKLITKRITRMYQGLVGRSCWTDIFHKMTNSETDIRTGRWWFLLKGRSSRQWLTLKHFKANRRIAESCVCCLQSLPVIYKPYEL